MKRLKQIFRQLKRTLKFSISDPESFKEISSVNSTGVRVISLGLIILLAVNVFVLFIFGFGPFGEGFAQNDVSIEREKLEAQNDKIRSLSNQIENQSNYIANVQAILRGEVLIDSTIVFDVKKDTLKIVDVENIDSQITPLEERLAAKVKQGMSTNLNNVETIDLTYFMRPVVGVVSQGFDKKTHCGVDIVTEKNATVNACLSGIIIYAGYTHLDGHIVVIKHQGNYLSVYKHNQRVLKKIGAKVKIGDPIAIVGNTGENSDGPHLHFELWNGLQPVNPENHMKFKR